MSLYLGKDLIEGDAIYVSKQSGVVTSDSQGLIIFPQFDFEPNLIILHNVEFKQNESEPTEFSGLFLMAKKINNTWFTQVARGQSSSVYMSLLSNSTSYGSPPLTFDERINAYKWYLFGMTYNDSDLEFEPYTSYGFITSQVINTDFYFEAYGLTL